MKLKLIVKSFLALFPLFFISPTPAHAHLIGGNGLTSGLIHPLIGLDHLLAMVAIGIISTQMGRKIVWALPATFLTFMILGGGVGIYQIGMPFAETGIALSILILGVIIALSNKFSLEAVLICVTFFALTHGHAHGTEIPTIANPALYTLGFVIATSALHLTGVLIGRFATKKQFSFSLLRASGLLTALAGTYLLLAL